MLHRNRRNLLLDTPAYFIFYYQIINRFNNLPFFQLNRYVFLPILLINIIFILSACQPSDFSSEAEDYEGSEVLYLYNWHEYMPQQVLDNFEAETGISVISTTYQSNEEMYAKITKSPNNPPYDLIVPSNYYVDRMHQQGLLQPIDKSKISNFEQLNPATVGTDIDPENQYSIPYLWGTTGIAINSQAINPDRVNSWRDLWRPEFTGQLVLPNDMREVFGMTLLSLGYSVNSENPEEIRQAYDRLLLLLPSLSAFPSGSTRMTYIENQADIGMIWSGEVMWAKSEGKKDLVYKYPSEGAILWIDSFAIPKDAKNVEAAHLFINFILRPENSQIISRQLGYATPNLGSRLFMSASTKANTILYPTPEQFKNARLQTAISEAALATYKMYWNKLERRSEQLDLGNRASERLGN